MPIRSYISPNGRHGWMVDVSATIDRATRRVRRVLFVPHADARKAEMKLKAKLDLEVKAGIVDEAPARVSFAQLADDYLDYSKLKRKSFGPRKSCLERFRDTFGHRPASAVSYDDVLKYQTDRQRARTQSGGFIKASSVNTEVRILSACYTWGIQSGRIRPPVNPCQYIRALDEPPSRDVRVDIDAMKDAVRACPETLRLAYARALLLARFTGIRKASLFALDWSQVRSGVIYPANVATSKRVGRVPLRAGLEAVTGAPRKNGRILEFVNVSYVAKLIRAEGPMPWKLHDLRGEFITELLEAGIDPIYQRILAGHGRDLAHAATITERYARVSDDALKAQIEKLGSCQQIVNEVLEIARMPQK